MVALWPGLGGCQRQELGECRSEKDLSSGVETPSEKMFCVTIGVPPKMQEGEEAVGQALQVWHQND